MLLSLKEMVRRVKEVSGVVLEEIVDIKTIGREVPLDQKQIQRRGLRR